MAVLLRTSAAVAIALVASALPYALSQVRAAPTPSSAAELRDPSHFIGIADAPTRSVALFEEAVKVFQHPRCVNCHSASDQPRQTDRMRPHQPLVVRGADGTGAPGMACGTCHGAANADAARTPGAPRWQLAPASTALEGRSAAQICAQIKDPARNGNRDIAAILDHVATDDLVIWAWLPGAGRAPPPGTSTTFAALMRAWAETGAHCPPS